VEVRTKGGAARGRSVSHREQRLQKRACLVFSLRALQKMTNVCNFLNGSIPVNFEREIFVYENQNV
jgi:hypothetical protein